MRDLTKLVMEMNRRRKTLVKVEARERESGLDVKSKGKGQFMMTPGFLKRERSISSKDHDSVLDIL